jgi:outer membrane protein OmpU
MKKVLYGTTALATAAMLSTGAMAADKIKMGVGGYFAVFGVFGDQDDGVGAPGAGLRDHQILREGEIIFNGSTKLDNGITAGVQVQLEAETCGDQIDETFAFFSGGFGRINLGQENSAPYLMGYASPGNPHWGLNSPNFSIAASGTNAAAPGGSVSFISTQVNFTSDSEKISYFTPRMAGFQIGVSYTPENGAGGESKASYSGFTDDSKSGEQSEVIEVGVNYVGKFGGVDIALSGGYAGASLESATTATAPGSSQDRVQWNLGGRLTVAGFTIGGAYREDNLGTDGTGETDNTIFNVGVRYASGPWSLGLQYAHAEKGFSAAAGGGDDEIDAFELGGAYTLGPGISLVAGIQVFEFEDAGSTVGGSNDATVFYFGTALSF